jgi:hypothetical protein
MTTPNPTYFVVYRWKNPQTTSDYPFWAVAQDHSALLSLGDYGATLDWGIPDEASDWLARDFAPTGEILKCDLSTMRLALTSVFLEDAEFASVRFGAELLPRELQLVLTSQEAADQGPEYVIMGVGNYLRVERDLETRSPVEPAERAMLDVCASTFAELAAQYAAKIIEPPPPRYRRLSLRRRGGLN